MKVNIAQWNKYKNRIADELYGEPFDWLPSWGQRCVIGTFRKRVEDGLI